MLNISSFTFIYILLAAEKNKQIATIQISTGLLYFVLIIPSLKLFGINGLGLSSIISQTCNLFCCISLSYKFLDKYRLTEQNNHDLIHIN